MGRAQFRLTGMGGMPLDMILRRMWRERRLLAILLLAVCLVTGFFALGPLYVRAVSEAGVRFAVENTDPDHLNITLNSREPIGPDAWQLIDQELSGVVTKLDTSVRSAGLTCGFRYTLGQATNIFTPRSPNCYQLVSYSNMEELFTLASGRWPVRRASPDMIRTGGMDDEDLSQAQLGVYSRGQVEAVLTVEAAAEAGIEIGNRVVVGDEYTETAIVHIVGLVEPLVPLDDPFWEGQRVVVTGQFTPTGPFTERFDFGLIFSPGAYEDWLAAVNTEGSTYLWRMETNPDAIHADTLDILEERLGRVTGALQARYPQILILTGLTDLIEDFRQGLRDTEGPIILLSGAVLILMLYHLVTTVALVLEQQGNEWAAITSRGGSLFQLLSMQFSTVAFLSVVGFVVGPFIAQGILLLLEKVGPLAQTLQGASLGVRALPPVVFTLSGCAAVAAALVLTLPAWPAARHSLLRLKQLISRPPTRPLWARYRLDLILLIIGLALMLRLYFMISGDVGRSLEALLQDPAYLIRLIASGASDVGGLNDPFNLLGPALVLTGAALLWLRLFPLLMRFLGRLFGRSSGLTLPLALWSVERDPGHYAQLVLLLIGTLALGTASLALGATRDVGAWTVAKHEVGAYVAVTYNPREADPAQDWLALPEVTSGAMVMAVETPRRAGESSIAVFGVDSETFSAAFPDWAEAVAPLRGITPPRLPGQLLPDDAAAVTAEVYAVPGAEPTDTNLAAEFVDALGVPLVIDMTTVDPQDAGRFVTYTADLPPDLGHVPWRLTSFRMTSRRGDLQDFSHTVYLDNVQAVNASEESTLLAGFNDGATGGWIVDPRRFHQASDLTLTPSTAQVAEGSGSLQVDYRVRQAGGGVVEPSLAINITPVQTVPIVVSAYFADFYGRRSALRQPYEVGDEVVVDLPLPLGTVNLRVRVAAIVPEFLSQSNRDNFIIAWTDSIRPVLNTTASVHGFYDWNTAWLNLAERQPSQDFRLAAVNVPGVQTVMYAWDLYNEIQRDPLPNAITGMFFAGFWVSLSLSVLDFAFYMAVTARRRAIAFAVLQAMGWEGRNVWSLLAVEQAALVIPALLVGVALGALLAYLLLPFLELVGGEVLRMPLQDVVGLLLTLLVVFVFLMGLTAFYLRRMKVAQVLRLGEE